MIFFKACVRAMLLIVVVTVVIVVVTVVIVIVVVMELNVLLLQLKRERLIESNVTKSKQPINSFVISGI